MIEIKKSEYKDITVELIEANINEYTLRLENWRNSEGIAKPYANYWFVEEIVENDSKWELIDDNLELDEQQTHNELIDINHENYDYAYARANADDGYVSIGEQQDMQYWDAVNGTTTWQDHIREIKEKYPKT
jgi:hypothetical protein